MGEDDTARSFEVCMAACEACIRCTEAQLLTAKEARDAHARKIKELEDKILSEKIELKRLKELFIVETGIPYEIAAMRNSILSKMQFAQSEDITVKTKKETEGEIERLKAGLQAVCKKHPFVLTYTGYAGSRSHDYEDAYYGRRFCVVCGFFEMSRRTDRSEYAVLKEEDGRVVRHDNRDEKNRSVVWVPFEIFLEAFRDSFVSGKKNKVS